jgi:hypothetical protein
MLAFWAQFIQDNGEQEDVRLDVMPCFGHKRFLIRGEVSFYAAARMKMIMTYISELRIENPNAETNLLIIQKKLALERSHRAVSNAGVGSTVRLG